MPNTAIDLQGKKFGKLTVLGRVENDRNHRAQWLCQCECGKARVMNSRDLRRIHNPSCGCDIHRRETPYPYKHSRLYDVWSRMKSRCYNPDSSDYPNYGGRGISMCDEWRDSFQTFETWSVAEGYDADAPKGQCTIDRIDNNGNYCPDNCRWVDNKTQSLNRRTNRLITYKGETKTLEEFSQEYGLKRATIARRLDAGWEVERALTEEPKDVGRWK